MADGERERTRDRERWGGGVEEEEKGSKEMKSQNLGDPQTDRETNENAGEMEKQIGGTETHGEREDLGTRWRRSVRRGLKVSVLKKSLQ